MYPPVGIGQLRQAQQNVSLAGKLSIPKGTVVWIPHYGMHNARHNWEAPEKFDPGAQVPQPGRHHIAEFQTAGSQALSGSIVSMETTTLNMALNSRQSLKHLW